MLYRIHLAMNGVRAYNILKSYLNLVILEKSPSPPYDLNAQNGQQQHQGDGQPQQGYSQPAGYQPAPQSYGQQYGIQPAYGGQPQQHVVVSIHEHQMTRNITSKKELINCVYVFVYSLIKRGGFEPYKVPAPNRENERTCICVLRVSILLLHMIFLLDFGIFHLRILLTFMLLDLLFYL